MLFKEQIAINYIFQPLLQLKKPTFLTKPNILFLGEDSHDMKNTSRELYYMIKNTVAK